MTCMSASARLQNLACRYRSSLFRIHWSSIVLTTSSEPWIGLSHPKFSISLIKQMLNMFRVCCGCTCETRH